MRVANQRLLIIGLLFSGFLWVGCEKELGSPEAMHEYIAEEGNGLVKAKKIGDIDIKVTYRPPDLLVAQEIGKDESSEVLVDSLRTMFGKYAHFILSLSANGKEIEAYNVGGDFGSRVMTLAFQMPEYVYLLSEAKDTIPVADYYYQRTYGVGGSSDLLFAFDRNELEKTESFQFILNDFGLRTGNTRLRFETEDIRQTPYLKFK